MACSVEKTLPVAWLGEKNPPTIVPRPRREPTDEPKRDILKLQFVHNCLTRVITRSLRFCHSIPLLKSLHWLHWFNFASFLNSVPLPFKLILLTNLNSCLFSNHCLSPKLRELRSSGFHLLFVPWVKTHAGTRVFFSCCPYRLSNLDKVFTIEITDRSQ